MEVGTSIRALHSVLQRVVTILFSALSGKNFYVEFSLE